MGSNVRMGWMLAGVLVILVVLFPGVPGCASSQLSYMWKDPLFKDAPMRNMLIITVKKDPVRRRLWEDGLVSEL
jgi:hypothetical protein